MFLYPCTRTQLNLFRRASEVGEEEKTFNGLVHVCIIYFHFYFYVRPLSASYIPQYALQATATSYALYLLVVGMLFVYIFEKQNIKYSN